MKTIASIVFGLMLIPSVSLAAPLTVDQANSLISVVQSSTSTSTPASAFVPLITEFSSITVAQATSLITVVQAAPGVPATAFINLLLSFTVDPVVAQSPAPTYTQPVNNLGSITQPVIESPVMKTELKILKISQGEKDVKALRPFGSYTFIVASLVNGKHVKLAEIVANADDNIDGIVTFQTNGETSSKSEDWNGGFVYVPTSSGEKNVTFTSGEMSISHTLTVE